MTEGRIMTVCSTSLSFRGQCIFNRNFGLNWELELRNHGKLHVTWSLILNQFLVVTINNIETHRKSQFQKKSQFLVGSYIKKKKWNTNEICLLQCAIQFNITCLFQNALRVTVSLWFNHYLQFKCNDLYLHLG